MANILIVYSTTFGHTVEICQRLKSIAEAQSHQVRLMDFRQCQGTDIEACDKIVIGASIRYGRHSPQLVKFIEHHQRLLEARPNAFFSVNVVARKSAKRQADTNPYLRKFLKQILWKPQHIDVFAGKIDYPIYNFFDRFMIRLIMRITRGPIDPKGTFEFTDWQQVEAFGNLIGNMQKPTAS